MRVVAAGDLTNMVGEYVATRIGVELHEGMYTAVMVVSDSGILVAGFVFQNQRGGNIEMLCASETGAAWRPHVLTTISEYVFTQLGCVRCTVFTDKRNTKARKFLKHLGFELEGNLRLGYDGKNDALIYGLLAKECRFLADKDSGI